MRPYLLAAGVAGGLGVGILFARMLQPAILDGLRTLSRPEAVFSPAREWEKLEETALPRPDPQFLLVAIPAGLSSYLALYLLWMFSGWLLEAEPAKHCKSGLLCIGAIVTAYNLMKPVWVLASADLTFGSVALFHLWEFGLPFFLAGLLCGWIPVPRHPAGHLPISFLACMAGAFWATILAGQTLSAGFVGAGQGLRYVTASVFCGGGGIASAWLARRLIRA